MLYQIAITLGLFGVTAAAAAECTFSSTITIPAKKQNGVVVEPQAHAYRLADGSIVFLGRFTVDADGAPTAYHPTSSKGLDDLANAGEPGNWFGIAAWSEVRQACRADGVPQVQGAADPAPGFYVSPTSMTNAGVGDCRNPKRYVNSSEIPYVALSSMVAKIVGNKGRLAAVHNPQRQLTVMAIHADAAPSAGRGEGSVALAKALGYNPSARSGGTKTRENLYIVFAESGGFPKTAADVTTPAAAAYAAWGGDVRRDLCLAAVKAAPR